jgi:hypothetical protein
MQGMASYIYKNVQNKKLADVAGAEEQQKKKYKTPYGPWYPSLHILNHNL